MHRVPSARGLTDGPSSSLPPLEVLYRIRKQRPDVFDKLEGDRGMPLWKCGADSLLFAVYIDGGVKRGTGLGCSGMLATSGR